VNPVPDTLLLRKSGSARNRTRDLCECSQELSPLDHRYIYIYGIYALLIIFHFCIHVVICCVNTSIGPPLWSSGQSSWLLTQRSPVRFTKLPDFLSSIESGTVSTQPF
jgi:hypothetical protein